MLKTPFFLPEFVGDESPDCRLQVLVRGENRQIVEKFSAFCARLNSLARITPAQDEMIIAAMCPETMPDNNFLLAIADHIDRLCSQTPPGRRPLEIVETRRIAPRPAESPPPAAISKYFTLRNSLTAQCFPAKPAPELVLNSGHIFGSGFHPSTRLALEAMEYLADNNRFPPRVLDYGCGSGLLAMASVFFGGREITGIDICNEAVGIARKNVAANAMDKCVTITGMPPDPLHQRFDLVVANVSASVLTRFLPYLLQLLDGSGFFIASGLQGRQYEQFLPLFRGPMFHPAQVFSTGKWVAILLSAAGETGSQDS